MVFNKNVSTTIDRNLDSMMKYMVIDSNRYFLVFININVVNNEGGCKIKNLHLR